MASAALSRVSSRPSVLFALRQAMNIRSQAIKGNRYSGFRQFSIFNEFSEQLKGEAKSDPEFQKSVKNLNDNIKEDLGVRAHETTEKYEKAQTISKKCSTKIQNSSWRSDEEVRQLHKEWMAKHNRSYSSPSEEEKRFKIFKETLHFIDMHNAAAEADAERGEDTSWCGLNHFADLTCKELPMGYDPPTQAEIEEFERKLGHSTLWSPDEDLWSPHS